MQKSPFRVTVALSDGQFRAIGEITAWWSLMDWAVGNMIAQLLKTGKKQGRVIGYQSQVRAKLEMMLLLAELADIDQKRKEGIRIFCDAIERANSDRRLITHGVWAKDEDGNLHLLKYWGGKDNIKRIIGDARPMTDEDMSKLCKKITRLCFLFYGWYHTNYSDEFFPSPDVYD